MAMAAPLQSKKRKLFWDDDAEQQSILQLMMGIPRSSSTPNPIPNPNPNLHKLHPTNPTYPFTSSHTKSPSPVLSGRTLNLLEGGELLQYTSAEDGAYLNPNIHPHHLLHQELSEKVMHDGDSSDSFEFEYSQASSIPLPPGWEKCLDLKTGSMYYLNRSTGFQTSMDPRTCTSTSATGSSPSPSPLQGAKSQSYNPMNWPTSPSTSDLTIEPTIAASYPTIVVPNPPPIGNLLSLKHGVVREENEASTELDSNTCNLDLSLALAPQSSNIISSSTPFNNAQSQTLDNHHRQFQDCLRHHHHHDRHQPWISNEASQFGSMNQEEDVIVDGPMVTLGCPNCLMFVMLSVSSDPKCPKCGSSLPNTLMPSNSNNHNHNNSTNQHDNAEEAKVSHNDTHMCRHLQFL